MEASAGATSMLRRVGHSQLAMQVRAAHKCMQVIQASLVTRVSPVLLDATVQMHCLESFYVSHC
jgi:hypothetical protein